MSFVGRVGVAFADHRIRRVRHLYQRVLRVWVGSCLWRNSLGRRTPRMELYCSGSVSFTCGDWSRRRWSISVRRGDGEQAGRLVEAPSEGDNFGVSWKKVRCCVVVGRDFKVVTSSSYAPWAMWGRIHAALQTSHPRQPRCRSFTDPLDRAVRFCSRRNASSVNDLSTSASIPPPR